MKKKLLSVILSMTMLLCVMPLGAISVSAATSGATGDCYWKLSGTELTIYGNGKMKDYAEVRENGATLHSVPWGREITSVIIENGVTSIGNGAFYKCKELISVTIGDSVTTIGGYAFDSCGSLTLATIPDSVTTIGNSAFSSCTSLTSVTIGDSVTTIGSHAFTWCRSLTSVIIGDSVTTIGNSAFSGCGSLTSVNIPDSVTSIESDAFRSCTSLTSVTIPDSVTAIGLGAFLGCTSLMSVTIRGNITSIGVRAFDDCDNLTLVTFGGSVTKIARSAFGWYSSLSTIIIESGVITLDTAWLNDCEKLTACIVSESNPSYTSEDGILFNRDKTALICYPKAKKNSAYTIPNSVVTIGDNAFYNCDSLNTVTIPNSVVTIGNNAFYNCDGLNTVVIPNSVTSIGEEAFGQCSSLCSVIIPNSVTAIGNGAFFNNDRLTSLTIPDSVISIGRNAFYDCDSLSSITIPDSVTTIHRTAFDHTAYAEDADNWDNGLLYINNHLIAASSQLAGDCIIKEGTRTIAADAFNYCKSLTSVTIPEGLAIIDEYTFSDCTSLSSVTLPKTIAAVNTSAFRNCTKLSDVYYAGSREDRNLITISESPSYHVKNTAYFRNAQWHYGALCEPQDLISDQVGHSVMENDIGLAFRFQVAADGVTVMHGTMTDVSNATVNYRGTDCKLVGMGAVLTNSAAIGETAFTLDDVNGNNVLDIPAVYLCDWGVDSCAFSTRIINIPDTQLERVIFARPYYIVEVDGEQITVYGDVDSTSCAEYM